MFHRLLITGSLLLLYWNSQGKADVLSPIRNLIAVCRGDAPASAVPVATTFTADKSEFDLSQKKFSLLSWRPLATDEGEAYLDSLVENNPAHYVIFYTRKNGWEQTDIKPYVDQSATTRSLFRSGFDFADWYNSVNPSNEIEFSQFEVRWAKTDNQKWRVNETHVHEGDNLEMTLAFGESGGTVVEHEVVRLFGGSTQLQAPSGVPLVFRGDLPHRSPPASDKKRLLVLWSFSPKTKAAALRRAHSPL